MRLFQLPASNRARQQPPHPAPDSAMAQLYACIAQHGCVSDALQQCTACELAHLMTSRKLVRSLAEQAALCDHPEGLAALQRAEAAATHKPYLSLARAARLRRQAISQGGARSAAAAVLLAELSVDHFCTQFPKAQQAWSCLVEKRALSPVRFVEQFGWQKAVIARWHAAGVLPDAHLTGWAVQQPDRMAQSLQSGACDAESFVACTPRRQQAALVGALLQQGSPLPSPWAARAHDAEAAAWQAFTSGVFNADTYVASVGEVPEHRRQAFAAHVGPSELTLLLRTGCLEDRAILAELQQGRWSATFILQHGPCSDAVVAACLRAAPLSPTQLTQWTVRFWQPHLVLPLHHRQLAQRADTLAKLVAQIPRHPDARLHRAYLLRMTAAFAEHQLAQNPSLGRIAAEAPISGAPCCLICLTPFAGALTRPALRDCAHPQDVCLPCNKLLFTRAPDAFHCVTPSCRRPLNPDDGLEMGLDPHRIAWHLVQRWRRTQPEHLPCVRTRCVGGADFDGTPQVCPVCTTALPLPTADAYDVQKAYLTRLVDSLGQSPGSQALVRECYHCGVATERSEGCAHLQCRQCQGHWHFSRGAMPVAERASPRLKEGTQSYVPRKGLLVRLGFYAGLTPGDTHVVGLEAQLRTRLLAYTPQVHQAAFARALDAAGV